MKEKFIKIMMGLLFLILISLPFCDLSSDISRELSGGYFYRFEGRDMVQIIQHSGDNEICSVVIDYDYNRNYIIAAQKPNGECLAGRDEKVYPMGYDTICYWIIVHKENAVYGPYSEGEFLLQREKLNVPSRLKLDVDRKYSP